MKVYQRYSEFEMLQNCLMAQAADVFLTSYEVKDGMLIASVVMPPLYEVKLFSVKWSDKIQYFIRTPKNVETMAVDNDEITCIAICHLFEFDVNKNSARPITTLQALIPKKSEKDYISGFKGEYFKSISPDGILLAGCNDTPVAIISKDGQVLKMRQIMEYNSAEIIYHVTPVGLIGPSIYFGPSFGPKIEYEVALVKKSTRGVTSYVLFGRKFSGSEDGANYYRWQEEPKLTLSWPNLIEIDEFNGLIVYRDNDEIYVADGLHKVKVIKNMDYSKKRLLKATRIKCEQAKKYL